MREIKINARDSEANEGSEFFKTCLRAQRRVSPQESANVGEKKETDLSE